MLKIILTPETKAELEKLHKKSNDIEDKNRLRAILLRSEDWSIKTIAQGLRYDETRVETLLKEYLENNNTVIHN